MQLFLSRGGTDLRLAANEFFKRPACVSSPAEQPGRCTGPVLVREISGDVAELQDVQNMDCAVGAPDLHYAETLSAISGGKRRAASERVHEHLRTALVLIQGLDGELGQTHMSPDEAVQVVEQLVDADLPVQLLAHLPHLEFEARKDVMNVCSALLRPELPQHVDKRVVGYLRNHPTFFSVLAKGYCSEELALHSGVVLRSCARHEELVEAFLKSGKMSDLISFAHSTSIEVSSDAFCTLRKMLVEHKSISSRWLETNFKQFFQGFNGLLKSGDYIAERQAQKLLTDLFFDKHFTKVMLNYVSLAENLAINMNLLRDGSRLMKTEAFQLFQLFVRNPQKPASISRILCKNKEKILSLLTTFPALKSGDSKFGENVKNTINKLKELTPPPAAAVATPVRPRSLTVSAVAAGSVQQHRVESSRRTQSWQAEQACAMGISRSRVLTPQLSRVQADDADDIDCEEFSL